MNTAGRRRLPQHMTVDEFIAWVGDGRWQLVDGEPRAMAPASATHGIIQARLAFLVTRHLETQTGSCVVVTEPAISRGCAPAATCGCPISRSPVHPWRRDRLRCLTRCWSSRSCHRPTNPIPGRMSGPTSRSQASRRCWCSVRRRSQPICCAGARTVPGPTSRFQIGRGDILHLECIGLTCPLADLYTGLPRTQRLTLV